MYQFQSFTISAAPYIDGYEIFEYVGNDGNSYHPGDVLSYANDGLVLKAVWKTKAIIDTATEKPISSAINSGIEIIEIPSDIETEESISIPNGRHIEIRGTSSGKTNVKATFTLGENSSLTVQNINLSSNQTSAHLISSTASNTSISLINSNLAISQNGRGISIVPSSTESNIKITAESSNISSENTGFGIFVSNPGEKNNISADIKLDNTSINIGGESGSYPLVLQKINQFDLAIGNNSSLSVNKNHYGITINSCGNENEKSTITIEETELTAYGTLYIYSNSWTSENIETKISNSVFTSINKNTQSSNSMSAIYIQSAKNCTIDANNTTFNFGKEENCDDMNLFYILSNDANELGNSISLRKCSIDVIGYTNPIPLGGYDIIEGAEETNQVTLDNQTINSLNDDLPNGTLTKTPASSYPGYNFIFEVVD